MLSKEILKMFEDLEWMNFDKIEPFCENITTDSVLANDRVAISSIKFFDEFDGFSFHVMNGAWDGLYELAKPCELFVIETKNTVICEPFLVWTGEHWQSINNLLYQYQTRRKHTKCTV